MKCLYSLILAVSLASLASWPLYAAPTLTEELEGAVAESDLLKVKQYLRKLDRSQMASPEKNALFAHLNGMSEGIFHSEKSVDGFLTNRWDIIRCTAGALTTVYALSHLVHSLHILATESTCDSCNCILCYTNCRILNGQIFYHQGATTKLMLGMRSIPYGGLAAAGLYQIYQGMSGASHKAAINSAKSIKALLKTKVGG